MEFTPILWQGKVSNLMLNFFKTDDTTGVVP